MGNADNIAEYRSFFEQVRNLDAEMCNSLPAPETPEEENYLLEKLARTSLTRVLTSRTTLLHLPEDDQEDVIRVDHEVKPLAQLKHKPHILWSDGVISKPLSPWRLQTMWKLPQVDQGRYTFLLACAHAFNVNQLDQKEHDTLLNCIHDVILDEDATCFTIKGKIPEGILEPPDFERWTSLFNRRGNTGKTHLINALGREYTMLEYGNQEGSHIQTLNKK